MPRGCRAKSSPGLNEGRDGGSTSCSPCLTSSASLPLLAASKGCCWGQPWMDSAVLQAWAALTSLLELLCEGRQSYLQHSAHSCLLPPHPCLWSAQQEVSGIYTMSDTNTHRCMQVSYTHRRCYMSRPQVPCASDWAFKHFTTLIKHTSPAEGKCRAPVPGLSQQAVTQLVPLCWSTQHAELSMVVPELFYQVLWFP